jgi:hypothetical protein
VSLSLLVSALQAATTAREVEGRERHEGKTLKYAFNTQE